MLAWNIERCGVRGEGTWGVRGVSNYYNADHKNRQAAGVYGEYSNPDGFGIGVEGKGSKKRESSDILGIGVKGTGCIGVQGWVDDSITDTSGAVAGVHGICELERGLPSGGLPNVSTYGVSGIGRIGVRGRVPSTLNDGIGVQGEGKGSAGVVGIGIHGRGLSGNCIGVKGVGSGTSAGVIGLSSGAIDDDAHLSAGGRFFSGGNGPGVYALGKIDHPGIRAKGGSDGAPGGTFEGTEGSPGIACIGGANGIGVQGIGKGSKPGGEFTGPALGISGEATVANGIGVRGTGKGTGVGGKFIGGTPGCGLCIVPVDTMPEYNGLHNPSNFEPGTLLFANYTDGDSDYHSELCILVQIGSEGSPMKKWRKIQLTDIFYPRIT
jgi:hypothetical protein